MVVGLTGAIASGKSLVSAEFKRLGAFIIDADLIARRIVETGMDAYNEIVSEFGQGIVRPDGSLDRKALGRIVFSDRERLAALNRITHPRIIEEIEGDLAVIRQAHPEAIIVVDAALIIELGLHRKMDRMVVVYSDEERCVDRMMRRDGLSETEARERLSAQMPLKEKLAYADYIIGNSGDMAETIWRAREVFDALASEGQKGA